MKMSERPSENSSYSQSLVVHDLLQQNSQNQIRHLRSAVRPRRDTLKPHYTRTLNGHYLSDLVTNVRNLSRNVLSYSMKLKMRNVFVLSKVVDKHVVALTRNMVQYLLRQESTWGKLTVYIQDVLKTHPDFGYASLISENAADVQRLKFWNNRMCKEDPNLFDFIITLGGDGTVLYSSWLFQEIVPPVLSFSLGSLGFLTNYDYAQKDEIIQNIMEDGVTCSLRMRFECTLYRAKVRSGKDGYTLEDEIGAAEATGEFPTHEIFAKHCILNDVVVDRGRNSRMTSTELYRNYSRLTSIEADGVVIATPSGSTAYSLSAGGSLVHHDIPGILISPICAHTLSFRPLVIPDSMLVRVGVPYDARETASCSFDGRCSIQLQRGDFLTINASRHPFPSIQNGKGDDVWFKHLTETLHWNKRKRQLPFTASKSNL